MVLTELFYGCSSLLFHARFWGLCRWGHDPFPGGRAARHLGSSLSCVLCSAPLGDLAYCHSECPAFADLRAEWCNQVSVSLDSATFLGSSFLDLQSQVFSQLHDSHPCTCLVCWASVRTVCRSLALLFSLLGSTLWLCAQRSSLLGALQSQVHPLLVSTLWSLAVLHCLQLFPNGAPSSPLCFVLFCWSSSLPLGAPQVWFLGNFLCEGLRFYLLCAFSQFPSASSSLSQCSLGCEAVVSRRLCQVEFSSCFQHREIHLTHPWCRSGFVCVCDAGVGPSITEHAAGIPKWE